MMTMMMTSMIKSSVITATHPNYCRLEGTGSVVCGGGYIFTPRCGQTDCDTQAVVKDWSFRVSVVAYFMIHDHLCLCANSSFHMTKKWKLEIVLLCSSVNGFCLSVSSVPRDGVLRTDVS